MAVTGYDVVLDQDLQRILEIMQTTIAADRLCAVAEGVSRVGVLIWGHHEAAPIEGVRLVAKPLTTSCEKQSAATLLGQRPLHVGDDSVAAECGQKQ